MDFDRHLLYSITQCWVSVVLAMIIQVPPGLTYDSIFDVHLGGSPLCETKSTNDGWWHAVAWLIDREILKGPWESQHVGWCGDSIIYLPLRLSTPISISWYLESQLWYRPLDHETCLN
jgi:hypothetical protein